MIKRKTMIVIVSGAVVGGIVGFLYYRFIGCRSNACLITSNPYVSTIYWAVIGGFVGNLIR